MIILDAGDDGLLAGEIFGLVFMIMFGASSVYGIYYLFKAKTIKEKLKSIFVIVVGITFAALGFRAFDIEHNLLTNSRYVEGTSIGYCKSGKSSVTRQIEFEYFLNGIRYTSCQYGKEGVNVPGDKFWIRVSDEHPDIGRVDYEKPVLVTGGRIIKPDHYSDDTFEILAKYVYAINEIEYSDSVVLSGTEGRPILFDDYYEVIYDISDPTIHRIDLSKPMMLFEDPDGNLSFEYLTYIE